MAIRNVIFDFGGVLVSWQPQQVIDSFYADPVLRDALRAHVFHHPDWIEMDRGTYDEATVAGRFAERMGRPRAEMERLLREHMYAALTPIEPTVALLRELHASGYRLYGLTNMSEPIFEYLERTHDFFGLFDGIVVSSRIKLVKPEPAIYTHLRERFALDFSHSVFLDDMPANVEGARSAGLAAIRFENAEQARRELAPLL